MTQRSCLSIILAAGEGTRMKSARPKVLHEIAGLPMVAHVAAAAKAAGGGDVALVIGHGAEEVRKAAARLEPAPEIFVQEERLGTAHAVLAARAAIARGYDDILVMLDRKSTRLNSSHLGISYAVFCLKKKNRHSYTAL